MGPVRCESDGRVAVQHHAASFVAQPKLVTAVLQSAALAYHIAFGLGAAKKGDFKGRSMCGLLGDALCAK